MSNSSKSLTETIKDLFNGKLLSILLLLQFSFIQIFPQNITNTLGTNGIFSVKDATNTFFSLNQSDGYLNLNYCLKLPNTTSSSIGVINKGNDRFLHNYGTYNTFLGVGSGNFTMTGQNNTAVGHFSLFSNTDGYYNVAIGPWALHSNTTGGNNIAIGREAMVYNTTGGNNVALGLWALYTNTTGYGNIGIGYYALKDNTTGYQNIGIGCESLMRNTTGIRNVSIGQYSLSYNTTGGDNSALGYGSLYSNTTGYSNTSMGYNSLLSNTTGYNNTSFGSNALQSNTLGRDNTAIGKFALQNITTGYENTAVGSYSLRYNTGLFNTGFGTYSLSSNTSGYQNTAIGSNSSLYNTTGGYNVSLGAASLYYNVTGSNNTSIGSYSLMFSTGSSNTALGRDAGSTVTTGSNLTFVGYNSQPSSNSVSNEITLGDANITYLRCAVTTITALSDARDKKNINDLNLGLDFLMKVKPRIYNWDKREWYDDKNSDGSKMQKNYTAGFIAQELDEVQKSENAEWLNLVLKNNPDKLEATPGNLLPVMVKAIQELKTEKDNEIAILKEENNNLKSRMTALEQKSGIQNIQTSGLLEGNLNLGYWLLLIFSTTAVISVFIKKYDKKEK